MNQVSLRALAALIATLNYGEEITYYNAVEDDEGVEAYGIARLYIHDADMVIINYLGGGSPHIIDFSRDDGLEIELLAYVMASRPVQPWIATPENTFVYLKGATGPVCKCGSTEFECKMQTNALVRITTEFGDITHDLNSEDNQSNDFLGPYTCTKCGATHQSINFHGEGGEDAAV